MQPQLAGNTLQTCRKPDFDNGKIGAETELTKN